MSCLPYWPLTNITVNDATKINANFTGLVACIAEGLGATGIQGFTGPKGETGPFGGPPGETGIQGVTGLANFTRGSSFPAAPQDLQLYWDNEDEIVYFYDDVNAKAWLDISSGSLGMSGLQGETGLNIIFTRGSAFPSSPLDLHLYWDNEDEIVYFYDDVNAKAWLDISSGTLGMSGLQGDTGAQGQTGVRGMTGPFGPTGMQGIQGQTGIRGATGVAGATGVQGVRGATGIRGITGIQGNIGGVTGMINANFSGTFYNVRPGVSYDLKMPFNLVFDNWYVYGLTGGTAKFTISKTSDGAYPAGFTNMHGSTGPFTTLSTKNSGDMTTWSTVAASLGEIVRITVGTGTTGMPSCVLAMSYRQS
jgi:hypothetical protein